MAHSGGVASLLCPAWFLSVLPVQSVQSVQFELFVQSVCSAVFVCSVVLASVAMLVSVLSSAGMPAATESSSAFDWGIACWQVLVAVDIKSALQEGTAEALMT